MGHIVLKSHKLNGGHWAPDGHFGLRPQQLVLPSEDAQLLDRFSARFHIKRFDEPGLSLVVPYLDDEFTYGDWCGP